MNGDSIMDDHLLGDNRERERLERMKNIVNELKIKVNDLKTARKTAETEIEFFQKKLNKLCIEEKNKSSFIEESEKSHEDVASEVERWSALWQSENGKKLLANARLTENAELVEMINRNIEMTKKAIETKRYSIKCMQSSPMKKEHKDEFEAIGQENLDIEKKIVAWQKENNRFREILKAMTMKKTEMEEAADRLLRRNKNAVEECHRLKDRILLLSNAADSYIPMKQKDWRKKRLSHINEKANTKKTDSKKIKGKKLSHGKKKEIKTSKSGERLIFETWKEVSTIDKK